MLQLGMGCRAPASALIEEHDTVGLRIKKAPVIELTACPRSAVEEEYRDAVRISDLFQIELMSTAHIQPLCGIGLDRRI
jgi:hypothetical protein